MVKKLTSRPYPPQQPKDVIYKEEEFTCSLNIGDIMHMAERWKVDPEDIDIELEVEQERYGCGQYARALLSCYAPNPNYDRLMGEYNDKMKQYRKDIRAWNKQEKERTLDEKRKLLAQLKKDLGED